MSSFGMFYDEAREACRLSARALVLTGPHEESRLDMLIGQALTDVLLAEWLLPGSYEGVSLQQAVHQHFLSLLGESPFRYRSLKPGPTSAEIRAQH